MAPIDTEKIRSLLNQCLAELGTPPSPSNGTIRVVKAGQSLQAAHDAATPGDTIQVEPGTYLETLTTTKKLFWTPQAITAPGRAKKDVVPVMVRGNGGSALVNHGADSAFLGFGFSSTDVMQTVVQDDGQRLVLDRVVILGDPAHGGRRGLLANGQGTRVSGCVIDDFRLPAKETQALLCVDGTNDLVVDDSYLGGGAQSVMFGGADSSSSAAVPTNIVISRSTLSKNPNWYAEGAQIKNALEAKSVSTLHVLDCVLEYAGIAEGQGAYVIVMTVRNQNGKAPWSRIEHVLIERCLCRFGGGCVNMLGTDDVHPSGVLDGLTIRNTAFTDIDPTQVWKGAGRGFLFGAGPKNVTLDGITFKGSNLAASMYFIAPPPTGMVLNNMVLPTSKYGIKIDAGGMGQTALQTFAPDAKITLNGPGATGYPVVA